jgi:hypothetical protein
MLSYCVLYASYILHDLLLQYKYIRENNAKLYFTKIGHKSLIDRLIPKSRFNADIMIIALANLLGYFSMI